MLGLAFITPVFSAIAAAAANGPSTLPFSTPASNSRYGSRGGSTTTGLRGAKTTYPDGRVIIRASEKMTAWRAGGFQGSLTAACRRELVQDVWRVTQSNYAYRSRVPLPDVTLWENASDLPTVPSTGFRALATIDAIASQFGKNDHQDEGTGDPSLGAIQTNSEVFGASVKISIMSAAFGENWKINPQRSTALIDVFNLATRRAARLPLVDVGPGESVSASVDLTWASDRFLGTNGQAPIRYRILMPT